jgi:hypothetical protein
LGAPGYYFYLRPRKGFVLPCKTPLKANNQKNENTLDYSQNKLFPAKKRIGRNGIQTQNNNFTLSVNKHTAAFDREINQRVLDCGGGKSIGADKTNRS